jgi:heme exporter protein D
MNCKSFGDFWSMGGYALYVWGSFGLTFALLALEVVLATQRQRAVVAQVSEVQWAQVQEGDWHA